MNQDTVAKNEEIISRIKEHLSSQNTLKRITSPERRTQHNLRRNISPNTSKVVLGRNLERIEVHQAEVFRPQRSGTNNENNITGIGELMSNDCSPLQKVQSRIYSLYRNPALQVLNRAIISQKPAQITPIKLKNNTSIQFQPLKKTHVSERMMIIKKVGKGKCAEVFLAKDKSANLLIALKVIQKTDIVKYQMQDLMMREIKIQASIAHPNIVQVYGIFADDEKVYLATEYCEQTLYHLKQKGKISYEDYLSIIYQVTNAIAFLHKHNIIHRDIKLENILVNDKIAKLGDFGLAVYARGLNQEKVMINGLCGTNGYMAPEVAVGKPYNLKADVYSLGVLAFELFTGKLPDQHVQRAMIGMPPILQDFLLRLLNQNPNMRISSNEALQHSLFRYLNQAQRSPHLNQATKQIQDIVY